ncbi:UNVERIFIED_CONTAM: hypothetical protein Sradi_0047100 [Sesamum radiatum]|uniref:Uncharacterized protein n=1 Tax=Sesamum radiatum TaxID=300843 RepID=A0AAW2WHG1_SESRA
MEDAQASKREERGGKGKKTRTKTPPKSQGRTSKIKDQPGRGRIDEGRLPGNRWETTK